MTKWEALKDVLAAEVVVNRNEPITAAALLRMMTIAENTEERENELDDLYLNMDLFGDKW